MGPRKVTKNDSIKKVHKLHISLKYVEPQIWRRILILDDSNLEDLHLAIQISFGWENVHLYEFRIGDVRYRPSNIAIDTPFEEGEETSTTYLKGLNLKIGSKIDYIYDFGDSWQHQIVVEDILALDEGATYPLCVDGDRAGPLEDSGGPPGYSDLCKALKNPKHPRHKEVIEWLGGEFDPNYFEVTEVNELLTLANGFKKKANKGR